MKSLSIVTFQGCQVGTRMGILKLNLKPKILILMVIHLIEKERRWILNSIPKPYLLMWVMSCICAENCLFWKVVRAWASILPWRTSRFCTELILRKIMLSWVSRSKATFRFSPVVLTTPPLYIPANSSANSNSSLSLITTWPPRGVFKLKLKIFLSITSLGHSSYLSGWSSDGNFPATLLHSF